MRDKPPSLVRERSISRVAASQHGLITSAQLGAIGFSRNDIGRRAAAGRLHRVHRGVYAVGHELVTTPGSRLAAVLAIGDAALASHATAAAIWQIRRDNGTVRHVVTPGSGRGRAGIRLHHAADLHPDDRAVHSGVPVTSVARTLVDLGDVVTPDHVRAAFVRAEQLRLLDMKAIDAALARANRRRGPSVLREVVRAHDPRWQATRSLLELRLLDAITSNGLPAPEVNEWVGGRYMVDFLWREHNLVLEADGSQAHGTAGARRRDARRDRWLRLRGFTVMRTTWREVSGDAVSVVAAIRDALSRAAAPRPRKRQQR